MKATLGEVRDAVKEQEKEQGVRVAMEGLPFGISFEAYVVNEMDPVGEWLWNVEITRGDKRVEIPATGPSPMSAVNSLIEWSYNLSTLMGKKMEASVRGRK